MTLSRCDSARSQARNFANLPSGVEKAHSCVKNPTPVTAFHAEDDLRLSSCGKSASIRAGRKPGSDPQGKR
jgi:hypothetical protein